MTRRKFVVYGALDNKQLIIKGQENLLENVDGMTLQLKLVAQLPTPMTIICHQLQAKATTPPRQERSHRAPETAAKTNQLIVDPTPLYTPHNGMSTRSSQPRSAEQQIQAAIAAATAVPPPQKPTAVRTSGMALLTKDNPAAPRESARVKAKPDPDQTMKAKNSQQLKLEAPKPPDPTKSREPPIAHSPPPSPAATDRKETELGTTDRARAKKEELLSEGGRAARPRRSPSNIVDVSREKTSEGRRWSQKKKKNDENREKMVEPANPEQGKVQMSLQKPPQLTSARTDLPKSLMPKKSESGKVLPRNTTPIGGRIRSTPQPSSRDAIPKKDEPKGKSNDSLLSRTNKMKTEPNPKETKEIDHKEVSVSMDKTEKTPTSKTEGKSQLKDDTKPDEGGRST